MHGDETVRFEAGIDRIQVGERARHQRRADEQDDGERNLEHHQAAGNPAVGSTSAGAARRPQRRLQVRTRATERRAAVRRESGQDREDCRNREHATVHFDRRSAERDHPSRRGGEDRAHAPVRQHDAESAANDREEEAFDQHRTHQRHAACAKRRANRHLTLTGGGL